MLLSEPTYVGDLGQSLVCRWSAQADQERIGQLMGTIFRFLFGYRSLAELRTIFPDVWARPEATLLINSLFPKQPSTVCSLSYT